MTPAQSATPDINNSLRLHQIFSNGQRLSIKVDSYFQAYEQLFQPYVGKPIVFVEVGVLNAGSLFMWREYFGPQARIIGVDANPEARQWERHGFEVHIGDQSSEAFWESFYQQVGNIDLLLDDGGHTNSQQTVTAARAFAQVRDGGLVAVEDVHASYMREFGNPSRRSFTNFAGHVVDSVNRRFGPLDRARNEYWKHVYSVSFYESIVVFNIDSRRCWVSQVVANGGAGNNALDFRGFGISRVLFELDCTTPLLSRIIIIKSIKKRVLRACYYIANKINDFRLAKYFR
jgi:hypothetical protein